LLIMSVQKSHAHILQPYLTARVVHSG
jgi:hypothetical protein